MVIPFFMGVERIASPLHHLVIDSIRGIRFLICVFWLSSLANLASAASSESKFYEIQSVTIPSSMVLEVGAIEPLSPTKIAVATRRGEIFFLDGVGGDSLGTAELKLFASGLHEVLGLSWREGWLYATQRGEVTRLKDVTGDGKADEFQTFCAEWGVTGDYHEYAFGSKHDSFGNMWVVLCLTGSFTSETEFRGWGLRIDKDGNATPLCSGIRSPGGIGANSLGDVFYTDNQGPWNGACSLKHLKPGAFLGNPSGNKWYSSAPTHLKKPRDPKNNSRMKTESEAISELLPPAVVFPYNRMGQSASGIACDTTGGKFGVFTNQLFVADQTHSTVMRVTLEKVRDRYQGACIPFKEGFASGNLALQFSADGSLWVGGTDRGWGARGGKPFALQRLKWKGNVSFEILNIKALSDGFEFTFTHPITPISASSITSYQIETFDYIYRADYGSPEVDKTTPNIRTAVVSKDNLSVRLKIDGMQVGHVHELKLGGVRSSTGESLLHPLAYYTLNGIPEP